MKQFTALILTTILLKLVGCNKSKITAYDVLQAQDIVPLIVRLPKDLKDDQIVVVEAYGESGIRDSSRIGNQFAAGSILKIFINRNEGYQISYVAEGRSGAIRDLDFGEATLRIWAGDSDRVVLSMDEPLVTFGIDGTTHTNPRGDDIAIRVTIEE